MQKYKWAITGSGWISTQMAQALQDTVHEITGIFSIDEEGAKEAADKYGIRTVYPSLESMLADSDADILYIGTPNEVHEQETVAALQAGKHVFCEKPL
ncbi:Gfo/Idh/MocA family protein, partial [Faecalibaculum rodentium]